MEAVEAEDLNAELIVGDTIAFDYRRDDGYVHIKGSYLGTYVSIHGARLMCVHRVRWGTEYYDTIRMSGLRHEPKHEDAQSFASPRHREHDRAAKYGATAVYRSVWICDSCGGLYCPDEGRSCPHCR